MTVYKRSVTSQVALEEAPLPAAAKLLAGLHIEVPNDWSVSFSSQKNILTLAPQVAVSLSELSSRLNSMDSKKV